MFLRMFLDITYAKRQFPAGYLHVIPRGVVPMLPCHPNIGIIRFVDYTYCLMRTSRVSCPRVSDIAHTYIHAYTHTHIHTCIHTYIHTYTYTHTYILT